MTSNIQKPLEIRIQRRARSRRMLPRRPPPPHVPHVPVGPHDGRGRLPAPAPAEPLLRAPPPPRLELRAVVEVHGPAALPPQRRQVGELEVLARHAQDQGEGEQAGQRGVALGPHEVVRGRRDGRLRRVGRVGGEGGAPEQRRGPAGEGVLGDGVEEVARLLQRLGQEDEPELACSFVSFAPRTDGLADRASGCRAGCRRG